MSYQVIARKWRPQNFDQLIGQSHVAITLTNALKKGRIPHALLFTGPRGTGKTSSARLLAKSLRCESPVDSQACGQCPSCLEFIGGRPLDVVEIDAASNNGVDSVRELCETVSYMPTRGQFKVYIIDEVHMLSTAAFNALLKTLEEPPAHVVFVLATTEVQKIPMTILSRCQRFDFRRISARQIMEHLKKICEKENIAVDSDALWIIARQGDGSMRDSQTLLDQVITFSDGQLTDAKIVELLGLTDRALIMKALSALVRRDGTEMLQVLSDLSRSGNDSSLFLADLLENTRHLLLVKKGQGKESQLLEISDSELVFLQDLSIGCSEEDIHFLFDMALKGTIDIQRSSDPEVVLEMILLRMTESPRIEAVADWLSRGTAKPEAAQAGAPAGSAPAPNSKTSPVRPMASAPPPPQPPQPPAQRKSASPGMERPPLEKWLETVSHLRSHDPLLAAKVEQLTFVGVVAQEVQVSISPKLGFLSSVLREPQVMIALQASATEIWGAGYTIRIRPHAEGGVSAVSVAESRQQESEKAIREQHAAHPKVKSAINTFKAPIKTVRELKEE
jgi:DNA polymerase-3 subunit gamma/tau